MASWTEDYAERAEQFRLLTQVLTVASVKECLFGMKLLGYMDNKMITKLNKLIDKKNITTFNEDWVSSPGAIGKNKYVDLCKLFLKTLVEEPLKRANIANKMSLTHAPSRGRFRFKILLKDGALRLYNIPTINTRQGIFYRNRVPYAVQAIDTPLSLSNLMYIYDFNNIILLHSPSIEYEKAHGKLLAVKNQFHTLMDSLSRISQEQGGHRLEIHMEQPYSITERVINLSITPRGIMVNSSTRGYREATGFIRYFDIMGLTAVCAYVDLLICLNTYLKELEKELRIDADKFKDIAIVRPVIKLQDTDINVSQFVEERSPIWPQMQSTSSI